EGGVVQGHFAITRCGGVVYAENHAVGRRYVTGWYDDPPAARDDVDPPTFARLYTHEANHHPDGGQIFIARDRRPFVALLAKPTDDVRPEDFVAFWCDGSRGLHVDPEVWHQPVFPVFDGGRVEALFDDKQGRVHACVSVDFVGEFGVYVEVPLG
ncbi:MAG: ureidoglycolate lyase, partial [Myxococcales bacterium]|nr:ureidoglycolate lyase [Myxococcales bacterium]